MSKPTVADLLKKVRQVEITARRKVDAFFAGQYHSVFRGQGIEFDEVREYQPGDDVRSIDWNVTARTGIPFIKRFREERELTVLLVVDVSASSAFGSRSGSKLDFAVEVGATLMMSALKNQDKVGLLRFANAVEDFHPPRKGRTNLVRLLRELVATQPVRARTNIGAALDFVQRVQKRRSILFLMSDFIEGCDDRVLRQAARRHDLVAIRIVDRREEELPPVGFVTFEDAETGEQVEVDTSHPMVRQRYAELARIRQDALDNRFRRLGVDLVTLDTGCDHILALEKLFHQRERRFR